MLLDQGNKPDESLNTEAKLQLAKYYYEVKINPKKYKHMPKEGKKDIVATKKTQIKKKDSDSQVMKRKKLINLPSHFHWIPSNDESQVAKYYH